MDAMIKPDNITEVSTPTKPPLSKTTGIFLLLLTLLTALIPTALVVADRWMGIIRTDIFDAIWCKSLYLCRSMIPSYFILITGFTVILPILVFFQRKTTQVVLEEEIPEDGYDRVNPEQARVGLIYRVVSLGFMLFFILLSFIREELPGWGLVYAWLGFMAGAVISYLPMESVKRWWEQSGEKWMAIALAHCGLVGLMVGIYGKPDLLWSTVVLAILVGANLWRFRREIPGIFWIMSLALVVFTIDINGWWTSVVGDEFTFHDIAWRMSDILNYRELNEILFRADGAHTSHTYISSLFQVLSMKFFGSENFGWRFSNPYQCSLAVGLFYYFCSTFISRRQSLVAAFLFSVSSYIMSFGKIGYNNLQALFGLTLLLAMAAWILRNGSRLSYIGLGCSLVYCFYAYPAALYAIPLPIILLVIYRPPRNRELIMNWVWMLLICILMIIPLMVQPVYWTSKLTGTTLNQPSILGSSASVIEHFGLNFFFAFYSFLYAFAESHFIAASYVDPLTGSFFLIGLCVLVFQAGRRRFHLFILFAYLFFLVVIGTTHDRTYPPHTRMFLLVPLYALIAAWGIFWVGAQITRLWKIPHRLSFISTIMLAVLFPALNLYQAFPLSNYRYADMQSIETLFIRLSQNLERAEPRRPKNYVIIADENWGITGFLMLQKAYPHLAWAEMHEILLAEPVIPDASKPLLSERDTIILLMPWMDPVWVNALDAPLRDMGKEPCEMTTYTGLRRTTMYHAPDLPQACTP